MIGNSCAPDEFATLSEQYVFLVWDSFVRCLLLDLGGTLVDFSISSLITKHVNSSPLWTFLTYRPDITELYLLFIRAISSLEYNQRALGQISLVFPPILKQNRPSTHAQNSNRFDGILD